VIFGVGYRRSGSLSLAKALEELGYSCIHWEAPNGRKLPDIVSDNIKDGNKLLANYEYFDAFVDYPIYVLHERLQVDYPDAKFIATYRDPIEIADSWARKMERSGWQPATFDQHGLYRHTQQECQDSAENHYEVICQYFQGNPNFLLFNVKDGWAPLCRFLDMEVCPSTPFPHVRH